ncbi:MAG: ABC transporter substrate-binding protein [Clostridiales bacterium]|nr:ABC transporter substrate-binding protein [Clostridiales bacterium]
MKKHRIAIIAFVLIFCVLVPAACGAPSSKQSAENGDVNIGIIGPFTGNVAQYGLAVRNGAMLYIEEYNAAGGLNGKQIHAVPYDEEGDPAKALTGYHSLIDSGVTAIIGSVTSRPTMAIVPEALADEMPMITASATAAAVTYDEETGTLYGNMFRSCFIDPFQGEKMADFAKVQLNAATAAVIFNTGDDYSIGLKEAFVKKANEIGLTLVAQEGYADGAVDFQSQLTNIAAKNPDVLFAPDYYNTIALISGQARNAGVTAVMLGGDGWDTVLNVMTDAAPIEGSFYCSGYSVEDTTPSVQTFLAAYEAKYNEVPNMFAAQAYDAAMILLAAMEQAEESGHAVGSIEYRRTIINAMRATNMEGVTGHITYDEFNNPVKTAVIINIENGEAKFWGKF